MKPTLSDIAMEAREWEGTPYHDLMRSKRQGCDCVGTVLGVGRMCKAVMPNDRALKFYGRTPHNHVAQKDADKFMDYIGTKWSDVRPGLVGLFWWRERNHGQHFAIFDSEGERTMMIHSYYSAGKVVRSGVNDFWRKRLMRVYTMRGVAP